MVSASGFGVGLLMCRMWRVPGGAGREAVVWDRLGQGLWLSAAEAPSSSAAVDIVGAAVGVLSRARDFQSWRSFRGMKWQH